MAFILGIETSCDDTAAAVVEDGRLIHSSLVSSQVDLHRQYGGVFPEMASRQHILTIVPIVEQALAQAGVDWDDLAAVAVTYGPGLVGSLLVGVNLAKGLALARGLPLIGINHLEGHLYANWLYKIEDSATVEGNNKAISAPPIVPAFPLVCLIVSGGHTELILMAGHGQYRRLGGTIDDAAGEAFDKVGRLLGLDYPGGPAIQQAARGGKATSFKLPRAWLGDSYDFSFSGLKTAVLRLVQRYEDKGLPPSAAGQSQAPGALPVANLAASFQAAVVDVLVEKTRRAAEEYKAVHILLAGGVAANTLLRREMQRRANIPVISPLPELCCDNAAMVAGAAYWHWRHDEYSAWDLDVIPNLKLA